MSIYTYKVYYHKWNTSRPRDYTSAISSLITLQTLDKSIVAD